MNDDNYTNEERQMKKSRRVTRIYVVLSLISVVIMVVAAYITYGYQKRELIISYDAPREKEVETVNNSINISPDISRVPSDKEIERILNDVIPDDCDDCDDDPLDCLEEYEINTIFVQHNEYQDQLIIELITGKSDYKYMVVIDLNNDNAVLTHDGKIDDKMCLDGEGVEPVVLLEVGVDPVNSHYLDVPGE